MRRSGDAGGFVDASALVVGAFPGGLRFVEADADTGGEAMLDPVAAVIRCPYGTRLHAELARLHGATEAEVAEAVHYAALVSGWGAQMAALAPDLDGFNAEVDQTVRYLAKAKGLEP